MVVPSQHERNENGPGLTTASLGLTLIPRRHPSESESASPSPRQGLLSPHLTWRVPQKGPRIVNLLHIHPHDFQPWRAMQILRQSVPTSQMQRLRNHLPIRTARHSSQTAEYKVVEADASTRPAAHSAGIERISPRRPRRRPNRRPFALLALHRKHILDAQPCRVLLPVFLCRSSEPLKAHLALHRVFSRPSPPHGPVQPWHRNQPWALKVLLEGIHGRKPLLHTLQTWPSHLFVAVASARMRRPNDARFYHWAQGYR